MTPGDRIGKMIKEKGWSIQETAFRLGFSMCTVSNVIRNAHQPGQEYHQLYALVFGVPQEYLFSYITKKAQVKRKPASHAEVKKKRFKRNKIDRDENQLTLDVRQPKKVYVRKTYVNPLQIPKEEKMEDKIFTQQEGFGVTKIAIDSPRQYPNTKHTFKELEIFHNNMNAQTIVQDYAAGRKREFRGAQASAVMADWYSLAPPVPPETIEDKMQKFIDTWLNAPKEKKR